MPLIPEITIGHEDITALIFVLFPVLKRNISFCVNDEKFLALQNFFLLAPIIPLLLPVS